MMTIFSSFDLFFSEYSAVFYLFFSLFGLNYFFNTSTIMLNMVGKEIEKIFLQVKSKSNFNFTSAMLFSLITMIFIWNFYSIFPYIFPWTSQMSTVLSIAMVCWFALNLFYMYKNLKMFLAHNIPESCPIILMIFLFMIEVVSNIIRPLTLTVRLVANILSGHILMVLLSKLVFMNSFVAFLYVGLNVAELFVSLIQCYIFVILVSLYLSDLH